MTRTTLVGSLALASALINAAQQYATGHPVDVPTLLGAIGLFLGLFHAADAKPGSAGNVLALLLSLIPQPTAAVPAPSTPEAAAAPAPSTSGPTKLPLLIAALLAAAALGLSGCLSTSTGNAVTDAKHAAINQALSDSAAVLTRSVVNGVASAVTQEATGGKVSYQQAGAAALQVSDTDVTTAISDAVAIATAGKTPKTVAAVSVALDQAQAAGVNGGVARQAIANVIWAKTGAPPANPATAIAKAAN